MNAAHYLIAAGIALGVPALANAQSAEEEQKPERTAQPQGAEQRGLFPRTRAFASRLLPTRAGALAKRALQRVAPLVAQEREYLRNLTAWLGGGSYGFVGGRVSDTKVTREQQVRGVEAQIGHTKIQRLRFRTAEAAQEFALHQAVVRYPTLIEVRGNQVLQIQGRELLDPERATRLRERAWEGLPHAPGAPSLAAVYLGPDEFYLESRISNPDLRRSFERALEGIRARVTDESGEIRTDDFAARVEHSPQLGSTVWFARQPRNADRIAAHAKAFQEASRRLSDSAKGSASRGSSHEGAGSTLERLLTRPMSR
ncbi:MAG: hypothetical protein JKY65_21505 [Planctomycetes bacterium]|nr:hypothetical protein [Planctomycetota bacterium]